MARPGAGKTTVTNLITRLWDIQGGEIRVDGIPVKELPLAGLRKAVQPVLQDVFSFLRQHRGQTSVWARRLARRGCASPPMPCTADEFIEAMSDGYKTILAEGATNLSSGQRQIISFRARSRPRPGRHHPRRGYERRRYGNRAYDPAMALKASSRAHERRNRASSLDDQATPDRIIVLAGGKVAEEGRHEELLRRKGLYWNLYRLQYGRLPR